MMLNKNQYGMKKNFIMFLCLVTVVFLTIIFCILNIVIYKSIYSEYSSEAQSRLSNAVKQTSDVYTRMVDKEQNIINSTLVMEELKNLKNYDINELVKSYDLLDRFFHGFDEYGKFSSEQIVMYLRGNHFPEGEYINRIERLEKKPFWNELENSQIYKSTWYYDDEYISVYRHLRYYDEDFGYLEVQVPLETIESIFEAINTEEYEKFEIISPTGETIYSGNTGSEQKFNFTLSGELPDDSVVVFSANKLYAMKSYFYYAVSIFVAFIIMAVLCYFIYTYIVGMIMSDLYKFILNIQSSEKVLLNADLIEVDGDKDIRHIKEKFKELITKNNRMHLKIEEINREKSRVELNFLQSCINPHLLYNSLSAIKWLMMDNVDNEVLSIIDDMTDYYRAVLAEGDEFISIREEIRLTERYVEIIKAAYSIDINLEIDAEEEILDCYIIKLLLQPIVENAVIHGVNGIDDARIKITVKSIEEDVIFEVADNGYGIDDETLKNLYDKNSRKGFGLRNSRKRIAVYYGKQYGISIDSKEGEGTKVSVRVKRINQKPDMKGIDI